MKFLQSGRDYFSSSFLDPIKFADLSRIKETVSIPTRTITIMDKTGTRAEFTDSPEPTCEYGFGTKNVDLGN